VIPGFGEDTDDVGCLGELDNQIFRRVASQDDAGEFRGTFQQAPQQFLAGHSGHHQIDQCRVEAILFDQAQRCPTAFGGDRFDAGGPQFSAKGVTDQDGIVYKQYFFSAIFSRPFR